MKNKVHVSREIYLFYCFVPQPLENGQYIVPSHERFLEEMHKLIKSPLCIAQKFYKHLKK
jgi:hypothetical protein